MNHDVFISYSSKNSTAAQAICHELEDCGIKCWMAPRDIPVGSKYASVISKAIIESRIVVLVFSDQSARSPWVESEINIAFSNRKTIVPYKIDKTNFEDFDEFYLMLNNRHWIEAYPDYKTRFKELVAVVAQTLGKDISASKPAEPTPKVTPTPTPTPKPNNVKRYWWVALCVLILGVATWRLLPEKSVEPTVQTETELISELAPQVAIAQEPVDSTPKANEAQQVQNKAKETQSVKSSTPKQSETKSSTPSQNTTTTSTPKVEQKSVQAVTAQKAETKDEKNDNSYLLNLPDSEFVIFVENEKYGFKYGFKLKSTGEVVIEPKYDGINPFSEGLAMVRLNGKLGFIDKIGKEVVPFKYDDAWHFWEGLAWVKLNGKYGFIDKTGNEITPLKYDHAGPFWEGLARVKLNEKWGFVDKTGKEVIPCKYGDAWRFREGLATVELNGKWGFIDKTGKEVIPLKYDHAYFFSKGKAEVKLNGEAFYIDKNGNRVK